VYLVQVLATGSDIRGRCAIRAQLETAGVLSLFRKLRSWNDEQINRMIEQYEEEAESDRRDLADEHDRLVLRSLRNPQDVFAALLQKTQGTKASAYLLDALRHMVLIKEEGDQKVRYFQLIDRLITSIVTSDTPDLGQDFSRAFGVSVSHLIGRFVEQERMDNYLSEVQSLKIELANERREKMELLEEMNRDDLVASLKAHVTELEERLRKSRAATEAVQDQMAGMKADYETRISDLELIIQELFNMLRESNHLDQVQGLNDGPINRTQLIHDLREQWERKKTIRQLEGKHRPRRKTLNPARNDDGTNGELESASEEDDDAEVLEAEKVALGGEARGARVPMTRSEKTLSTSQFMDAPEERVRAHIEVALSKEADHVVCQNRGRYKTLLTAVSNTGYEHVLA
jgi:cytokinesis protein